MALIKCPECQLQVSDKAITCPHCGYPLDTKVIKRQQRKPTKRRRLPNGFGTISEIKNQNLRKPFRALVCIGKNFYGKPIYKSLKPETYFKTYNDAYAALLEYHKNPYDLDSDLTVEQLYEKWTDKYFESLSNPSSERTIKSAWNYCSAVYNMRAKDLRARHIKGCMEDGTYIVNGKEKHPSPTTKTKIKSLFNLMLDYAEEHELVDKNYARTFKLADDIIKDVEEEKKDHIDFTNEEMQKLWNNLYNVDYVDVLLIQCYSGWRPQELGLLKIENVDLENWFITGGMKTDAGKDRVVPVHPKIRSLVKYRYQEAQKLGSEYLINCTDTKTHRSSLKLTYDKYRHRIEKIIKELDLNPDHRAHDGRIQFATMAGDAKMNEYAVKRIMGHKIKDITENTYTKRKREWLMEEILKIK